jgi:site-specific recombinase XerC
MKPPRKPRTIPRAMPKADVGRLFDVAPDPRARAIVALGVGCGLRCVEISRLRVEDWDRAGKTLRITGKSGHQRELPVPGLVQQALTNYMVGCPATTGPLIRSYVQRTKSLLPATISDLVASWMALAGVKVGPRDGVSAHALRHTCASDVLDECGDLRVVQEMLGHEHLSTTAIYLRRAGIGKLRDAMEGRRYRSSFDQMIDKAQARTTGRATS